MQPDRPISSPVRKKTSVDELIRAKRARPIRSVEDLTAHTFESDEELDEFLAFIHSERHFDLV
ncbi:hypothetical protein [Streptosporangium lutulentum]|uniref:Uncharacterized protein n=1 Tax=Streptosporangium lutulentum TaxID=1461250 RepID=A0ABT9QN58_9ACTN|nr:hypothetical protein [Streptosporangium lutulentum]MDP9847459.1 hypothetical protein [Streptosporangium lutulentum]